MDSRYSFVGRTFSTSLTSGTRVISDPVNRVPAHVADKRNKNRNAAKHAAAMIRRGAGLAKAWAASGGDSDVLRRVMEKLKAPSLTSVNKVALGSTSTELDFIAADALSIFVASGIRLSSLTAPVRTVKPAPTIVRSAAHDVEVDAEGDLDFTAETSAEFQEAAPSKLPLFAAVGAAAALGIWFMTKKRK